MKLQLGGQLEGWGERRGQQGGKTDEQEGWEDRKLRGRMAKKRRKIREVREETEESWEKELEKKKERWRNRWKR